MEFIAGTVLGAFLGAFFGHFVPKLFTFRSKARKINRHIQWAWEDFDLFVKHQKPELIRELDLTKENLVSRGVLASGEAISARARILEQCRTELKTKWRETARLVDDLEGEIGLMERFAIVIPKEMVSEEAQDRRLRSATDELTSAWSLAWPPEISSPSGQRVEG
jgi:hypothetical protein